MPVIVTRPESEAAHWVQLLRGRGVEAIALPLIAIAPAQDGAPLHAAWASLAGFAAVMFVSGNAVREFFRLRPPDAHFTPQAWAPGPGTRDALIEAGVPAGAIVAPAADAAQFDSEALWTQVQGLLPSGARLLIVRGGEGASGNGRDWLAQQLAAGGVRVQAVAAYARELPAWSGEQSQLARQAAGDGSIWLFSSSEAVANLGQLLPQQDWSRARAVATHPRIAQAARAAGFGRVDDARPQLDAVIAALESVG